MTCRADKRTAQRDAQIVAAIREGAVTTAMLTERFQTNDRAMLRTLARMRKTRQIEPDGWVKTAIKWAPVDGAGA